MSIRVFKKVDQTKNASPGATRMFNKQFASTYQSDMRTVEDLGLKKFEIMRDSRGFRPRNISRFLGSYKKDDWVIRVTVECLPAQFFQFKCTNKKTKQVLHIQTGSGNLTDYVDRLDLLILDDMIEITELKKAVK